MNKKAFTLVELLVVIAIIGLIAAISIIALGNARAKSRDSKRVADIKQIQSALELFFNDNNRYPTLEEWNTGSLSASTSLGTTTYLAQIPSAPSIADGSYCDSANNSYNYASNGDSYSLRTCLGNKTGSLNSGILIATPSSVNTCGQAIAQDVDGNNYTTTQVGTQCWLKENLNVGTMLCSNNPGGASCTTNQTDNSIIEKYCYINSESNCNVYGALYQWDEAMQYSTTSGAQGICPVGWHIPTDNEQYILENYLTTPGQTCNASRVNAWGCSGAATALKEAGTTHWYGVSTPVAADNSSGFTDLPTGLRNDSNGVFNIDNQPTVPSWYSYLWSSSLYDASNAWRRGNYFFYSTVRRNYNSRTFGFAVRCIKD